jgi:hypothetical protein
MESFSCGYCGTQLIVRRQDGTVSLKRVTEAIQKVQIGTDRTAAELTIARYEREMQPLSVEVNRLLAVRSKSGASIFLLGVLLVLLNFSCCCGARDAAPWPLVCGIAVIIGGFLVAGFPGGQEKELRGRIQELESLIAEKKRSLDA